MSCVKSGTCSNIYQNDTEIRKLTLGIFIKMNLKGKFYTGKINYSKLFLLLSTSVMKSFISP